MEKTARAVMQKYGTQIESWGPFAESRNDYFNNPALKTVASKHGRTAAQTALRFLLQSGVVVIPKSTHMERMIENFNVFDFELDAEDMARLEALDTAQSLFFSHYDPETVEWFMSFAK
ncbi:MAG: aldo/keto reductase [Clostridiales bacterium]|nr:aldo/keto reductase [Clostridiales bacterium]